VVLGHGRSKCSLQPVPKWSDEKADGGETSKFGRHDVSGLGGISAVP